MFACNYPCWHIPPVTVHLPLVAVHLPPVAVHLPPVAVLKQVLFGQSICGPFQYLPLEVSLLAPRGKLKEALSRIRISSRSITPCDI